MRVIPLLCLLGLLALPALAQQKLLPSQIKPDARMVNTAGTEIYLLRARPARLFNFLGQPVTGAVEVLNNTDAAKTLTVRAWITDGLDTVVGKQEKLLEVAAFSKRTVAFTWEAKLITPYGHALRFEVAQDGKAIASAEDFFVAHDNVWAVGIAGAHPVAYTADHVKELASIDAAVERFRANYTNTFEKFFWAPDDFADMTPTKERWYSGQARYHEQLDRLKRMCEYGLQIGVMPTTYGKSIGSGSGARDAIREKPELVYGFGGVMSYGPDTEELAKWDKEDSSWQSIGWAHYNMNDPAVVAHGINEIYESTKMFGWAGVRFDGHFRARTGKQRVGDEIVEFTPDMADAQTAANQRALKEAMWKLDPRYVFGYNYGECDFTGRLVDNPRESIELCADSGHIMDEYAKQNAGASHPFRKWADYAHAIAKSTEQVRRLGGHYFPMVHSSGPVGRFQNIFTFAAGGHPNGVPHGTDHPYNAFATRYAEMLWGENVKNLWNPCGIVIVQPGVLWEDYVREQRLNATHTRLIIHLINPPAQETATESEAALAEVRRRDARRREILIAAGKAKVEPDYSELDKLPPVKLYPDPKTDITVKLVPRALDDGPWTITRATLLDPETATAAALPVDTSERYFARVRVPELKFWAVIVVDLEKKEN
ncbi:MAG: hypothetical protein BWY76_01082 [bacterium ADurb.Bin429]|nr:MAG: hypothetical protein BWY76_01082 [bacterium ADurb.Bin429]